jgi:dienelactone hydrolase
MKSLLFLLLIASSAAAEPAPKDVDIAAPDGTRLKTTYFAAERPGPAVLLMHMCITTRASWEPVARQLSAAGIHALTIDNRGFGESGGPRFEGASPDVIRQLYERWPGDFDAAFAWLTNQPGVDKARIGAGGGSCGVDNAVKLASRHRNVRSLVLLAGSTDTVGIKYLTDNPWLPIFAAAAADDQYGPHFPQLMRWHAEVTGNARNRFVSFADGRHGTEIFGPHPELPRQIVSWFIDTLISSPADPGRKVSLKKTATTRFWELVAKPGRAATAAQMFRDARKRDPKTSLAPEAILNQLAYSCLKRGEKDEAVALFELNVEVYPTSANAHDSLADGYLARGQNDRALAAERKCLELLPADPAPADFKAGLKKIAEEKIVKLTGKSVG